MVRTKSCIICQKPHTNSMSKTCSPWCQRKHQVNLDAKKRAESRVNVRIQWVDEEDRDSLREVVINAVWPFLKTRQIQIKVSKGKTSSERVKIRKELDRVFSLFIRKRDSNTCVVCWSTDNPNNWHLFSRSNLSTRWDEVNCNCQCASCNILHEANPRPYTEWFKREYWEAMYEDLESRWNGKPFKVTNNWIKEKIEYYKSKL
mgnify:CR=1 FL=1